MSPVPTAIPIVLIATWVMPSPVRHESQVREPTLLVLVVPS